MERPTGKDEVAAKHARTYEKKILYGEKSRNSPENAEAVRRKTHFI